MSLIDRRGNSSPTRVGIVSVRTLKGVGVVAAGVVTLATCSPLFHAKQDPYYGGPREGLNYDISIRHWDEAIDDCATLQDLEKKLDVKFWQVGTEPEGLRHMTWVNKETVGRGQSYTCDVWIDDRDRIHKAAQVMHRSKRIMERMTARRSPTR